MNVAAYTLSPARDVKVPVLSRPFVLVGLAAAGIAAFFYNQSSLGDVIRHLALPDTDDRMRLVEVRDLLAGQGWFDPVQHRYLPPAGAWMPWSRLLDLPLALLIAGLTPLVGRSLAEGAVAALWPPALFLVYAAILFVGTRRIFGFRAACLAVFVAGQLILGGLFSFGRIDHHNVQVIAMTVAALALATPRAGWRNGLVAGAVASFSLAIGLETLPFVAGLGASLVLLWIWSQGGSDRLMVGFGAGLAVASLGFFAAETSPAAWFVKSCDSLSPPWLLLAVGGGLGVCGLAAIEDRAGTPVRRLIAAGVLGALITSAFTLTYPDCLAGPWAVLPEAARTGWLDQVGEMQSFWRVATGSPLAATAIGVPFATACGAALLGLARSGPAERRTFVVLSAFLVTGVVITLVHVRGYFVGTALVPVVAGWLFDRAIGRVPPLDPAGRRRAAATSAAVSVAALMTLPYLDLVPILAIQRGLGMTEQQTTSILERQDCSGEAALARLNDLPVGTLLAPVEIGPPLLLHTHHRIIAAPYHRNGEGIVAGIAAESGTAADVRKAAERFRPDYLFVCSSWTRILGAEGSLARSLSEGADAGQAEDWLDPILSNGDLRVYRVRLDRPTPGLRGSLGTGPTP